MASSDKRLNVDDSISHNEGPLFKKVKNNPALKNKNKGKVKASDNTKSIIKKD
jgi:hypothetical protein